MMKGMALRGRGAAGQVAGWIAGNLLKMAALLVAVSVVAFTLVTLSPVDPVQQYLTGVPDVSAEQRAALEAYWGLDQPPVQRFFTWAGNALHGDLGTSTIYRRPVIQVIGEKFANSAALMLCAWLFSGIIGFLMGCLMGMLRNRWPDRILKRICLLLCSVPTFWLGLLMLLVFAVFLGWFPTGFSTPIGAVSSEVTIWQRLHHLILPALTLSLTSFAGIALHTRQKLSEVLESDYVLFARARGESNFCILRRHGLRNILLPAVTLQFAGFAELFGGSVLAETVFSYPGLGSAVSAAGMQSDVPLLLVITLFSALFVFTGNLIANMLYRWIDPRIREGELRG